MIYLESFYLPSFDDEARYDFPTKYPFGLFSHKQLFDIHFSNITIFYGSNGSGKSTLLNVMNRKLGFQRTSSFYADEAFDVYTSKCKMKTACDDMGKSIFIPPNSKIIASEDIIHFILDIRNQNIKTEAKQKELKQEYLEAKYRRFNNPSLHDYDKLSQTVEARRTTQTQYIHNRTALYKQFSNGESVLQYFDRELENDGLYLLDEPENCLSPKFQLELQKLIIECSHYCDCQFIIATHSPFLLAIPQAKIYNLDLDTVEVCDWTKLGNVKLYQEFFKLHQKDFEE